MRTGEDVAPDGAIVVDVAGSAAACAGDPSDRHADRGAALRVEVVSDAICPWCWVAKRRLASALSQLIGVAASVTWLPFELNPGMPVDGMDRRAYRSAKFGSWRRSQELDAQVAAAALSDGLEFRHDRIERTPNTIAAHRLAWLARGFGRQDEVVEALFSAYFHEGRDIGDEAVLVEIGVAAGIDRAAVTAMYDGDDGRAEVEAELRRAAGLPVTAVPTVLVDGVPLFSGALPAGQMLAELRAASARAAR